MPGTYVIPSGRAVERNEDLLREIVDLLTEIRDRLPVPSEPPRFRLFGYALGEPESPNADDVETARQFLAGDLPPHVMRHFLSAGTRAIEQARAIAQSIVDRGPAC